MYLESLAAVIASAWWPYIDLTSKEAAEEIELLTELSLPMLGLPESFPERLYHLAGQSLSTVLADQEWRQQPIYPRILLLGIGFSLLFPKEASASIVASIPEVAPLLSQASSIDEDLPPILTAALWGLFSRLSEDPLSAHILKNFCIGDGSQPIEELVLLCGSAILNDPSGRGLLRWTGILHSCVEMLKIFRKPTNLIQWAFASQEIVRSALLTLYGMRPPSSEDFCLREQNTLKKTFKALFSPIKTAEVEFGEQLPSLIAHQAISLVGLLEDAKRGSAIELVRPEWGAPASCLSAEAACKQVQEMLDEILKHLYSMTPERIERAEGVLSHTSSGFVKKLDESHASRVDYLIDVLKGLPRS
jgi:hypothetical protein